MTAEQCLQHKWLNTCTDNVCSSSTLTGSVDSSIMSDHDDLSQTHDKENICNDAPMTTVNIKLSSNVLGESNMNVVLASVDLFCDNQSSGIARQQS